MTTGALSEFAGLPTDSCGCNGSLLRRMPACTRNMIRQTNLCLGADPARYSLRALRMNEVENENLMQAPRCDVK